MQHSVALLLLVLVFLGCSTQDNGENKSSGPSEKKSNATTDVRAETNSSPAKPRLWRDEQIDEMIKGTTGAGKAYVFRWENCGVEGWIKLQSVDGTKTRSYDLSVAFEDSKLPGYQVDSGWLVIAIHKRPNPNESEVRVTQRWTLQAKGGELSTLRKHQGLITNEEGAFWAMGGSSPAGSGPGDFRSVELTISGESYLELRLDSHENETPRNENGQ